MSKKQHQQNKPSVSVHREANVIGGYLTKGDFWAARRLAHKLSKASDNSSADLALTRDALKMTLPDPVALLVGVGCLIFSVAIAFWSAY